MVILLLNMTLKVLSKPQLWSGRCRSLKPSAKC